MEQYLLELIKNNNRVIVPNFGAFIVSRDAGTTVLFNNFLSFNDGLLINHVSSQEGIDTTQATQKVSEFVEKIKQELEENGEYAIEKLGRFTKDQNGILRFTQDPQVSELIPDKPADKEANSEKELSGKEDSTLLDLDSEDQASAPPKGDDKKTEKPLDKPTQKRKPVQNVTSLNDRQKKILEMLEKNAKVQVQDVIDNLEKKVTKRTIRRDFKRLVKMGFAVKRGKANTTHYRLKE